MNDQALNALTTLGLTPGEAKTYLALAAVETSEATPLADLAQVPQPRIYSYLEGLESKGIIVKTILQGKPNRYSAEDIDVVFSKLQRDLRQEIKAAKKFIRTQQDLNKSSTKEEIPVAVILGRTAIASRIQTIANQAENNVVLFYHDYYEQMVQKYFSDVNVEVITPLPQMGSHPLIQAIMQSEIMDAFRETRVMLLLVDVDFDQPDCASVNIVAFPKRDDVEPLLVHIRHPLILELQMGIMSPILSLINTSGR